MQTIDWFNVIDYECKRSVIGGSQQVYYFNNKMLSLVLHADMRVGSIAEKIHTCVSGLYKKILQCYCYMYLNSPNESSKKVHVPGILLFIFPSLF